MKMMYMEELKRAWRRDCIHEVADFPDLVN